MLIRYLRIIKRLLGPLIGLLSSGMSRRAISILFRLPSNNSLNGIVFSLLDNLEEGPIATRLGFVMHFKHTGHSTGLRGRLITGTHEWPYLMMIKKLIRTGDHVIDIGAHEGYFSLFMSPLVGETGQVFAVEPKPRESVLFAPQYRI